MKKCHKCGTENPNSVNICENCYNILNDEVSNHTSEDFFKKVERKDRIVNIINYILLILYFIIVVPLFYISVKTIGSFGVGLVFFFLLIVIIPVMFYASIFHPDILFELSYMNVISNIKDANPSDWFYLSTQWAAYLFLGLGVFIIVKIFFEVI